MLEFFLNARDFIRFDNHLTKTNKSSEQTYKQKPHLIAFYRPPHDKPIHRLIFRGYAPRAPRVDRSVPGL
jgi:hypothetical protein